MNRSQLPNDERKSLPMMESASVSISSSQTQNVMEAKERWESVLSSDREEMTDYERSEMEQDVQGKNILADLEPSATINMGIQNLKRELAELRKQHRSVAEVKAAAKAQAASPGGASKRSRSPSQEQRILNSSFIVENEDTLLRFIRADRLDAQKAAKRIIDYHSLAMELFGDAMLRRPILLDDLDRREFKLLESGWIQLLLTRDTHGRRIMTLDEAGAPDSAADASTITSKLKVLMYAFQVAALDEDTQKQGLHLITHRLFSTKSPSGALDEDAWMADEREREMMQRFFACTSVRCSIIHINTPSAERWAAIVPSVIQMFGADERGRIRFHHGSIAECNNEMESYGVPIEWMPLTSTGRRKLNEHKVWIKMQREREAATDRGREFNVVECPRLYDILLTKTRRASTHPGNQKLRQLLEERYEERHAAHPMKKQIITNQVADHLEQKYSCRFLVKNSESLWVPADRTTVLDKLGNSFRFVPRLKPKADDRVPIEAGSDHSASKVQATIGNAKPVTLDPDLKKPPASPASTTPKKTSTATTSTASDLKDSPPSPKSQEEQDDANKAASSEAN